MHAYIIIAAELAILYTVFWYVFLREPRPYRIKGNPWGFYDDDSKVEPKDHLNRTALTQEWEIQESQFFPNSPTELFRSQNLGIVKIQNSQLEKKQAANFLAKLGQTLNLLSIKLP
jgi:hypothetical protein